MEIYLEKQLINIVYSLILGLIFGGIYDIIRIIHILFGIASYSGEKSGMKHGTLPFILFFILDAAYAVTASVIYSLFNYFACNGEFRVFILASVCVGFFVYHVTLGRLVMLFSEAIVRLLKRVIHYTVVIPVCFAARITGRIARFVYRNTLGRVLTALVRLYFIFRTERCIRHLARDVSFNFEDLGVAK